MTPKHVDRRSPVDPPPLRTRDPRQSAVWLPAPGTNSSSWRGGATPQMKMNWRGEPNTSLQAVEGEFQSGFEAIFKVGF